MYFKKRKRGKKRKSLSIYKPLTKTQRKIKKQMTLEYFNDILIPRSGINIREISLVY